MAGSVSFAEAVEAVSPLGDAIDGSERPRPRPIRRPRREFDTDNRRTFFCSNPQCDHDTWSPVEQARHMAREFWEAAQAVVRLAPESPEALKLTGGVILRELSADDLREANAVYESVRVSGGSMEDLPIANRLYRAEYVRRKRLGLIPKSNTRVQRLPPRQFCHRGHEFTPENTIVDSRGRRCRECARTRQREAARRRMRDPEYRDRVNAQRRQWRAAKGGDA